MTEDLQVSMKVPWFVIARRAVLNKLFVVPGAGGGVGLGTKESEALCHLGIHTILMRNWVVLVFKQNSHRPTEQMYVLVHPCAGLSKLSVSPSPDL